MTALSYKLLVAADPLSLFLLVQASYTGGTRYMLKIMAKGTASNLLHYTTPLSLYFKMQISSPYIGRETTSPQKWSGNP